MNMADKDSGAAKRPDRGEAQAKYRRMAASYDRRLATARSLHKRAVAALRARPGETVVDVGCGTGLSFPHLEDAIGKEGEIIGVELSPEMAAQARSRAGREGWENVNVIESAVEEAPIPTRADAALFVLTHDIMRSRAAIENVVEALGHGGRVVAAGSKWAPRWALPVNAYVWLKARRYVTTFEGFSAPWSILAELVPDLEVEPILAGAAYLARAELR